jgi:large subunit ribosomal protein L25
VKRLKAGRFLSTLFNMKVDGHDDVRVICRGVQRDVVKDLPTHVDFMRLKRTSRINLFIHVDFVNHDKAPGIKRGGTLVTVRPEVELSVIAGDIPDHITVDLTGRDIGDVIHISGRGAAGRREAHDRPELRDRQPLGTVGAQVVRRSGRGRGLMPMPE